MCQLSHNAAERAKFLFFPKLHIVLSELSDLICSWAFLYPFLYIV